ncbi:bacillithiol biosynthesis cysteine-adding enzyme BshC [Pedobacter sp. MC2016-15]|uniref:bacillithiol biosynthesis cysteine-adding enzyme BshC n=1 Tax=Pedobacter sp. MC2016-15 TaxID=2994473 RepID=UPI00224670CA|nr:bacillithiol biosynthesis cysteine-adding enzyme BshC [Pedobacter sp. MC2016-15]MCX2481103.1 bacillithiol biosynthesis cysteine-adding enzyme BshC [Pedobacter sp. MC2016-15]
MQPRYINYQQTNSFSSVVLDYIDGKDELKSFYQYAPTLQGFQKAIEDRRFSGDRKLLADTLRKQYSQLKPSALVEQNINLLADDRTFTITTGHQLNIFTGPLYFIYKIVTAIKLAADLKKEYPSYNFVPVYWMATEDHDFEEINNVKVEDKRISWQTKAAGATGRINPKSITEALVAYKGYLGISENGQKLADLVDQAYSGNQTLANATRELVNALFGAKGLVCTDADDAALKAQFSSIVYRDITEQHSFKLINESSEALEKAGYKPQVNPREINFFYMDDQLRERIVEENNEYKVLNTSISFSKESLKEELNQHPERFSPNVVMRPVYQELILPNLAYIGGGAEVTYWLQLKANFDFYGIFYPVLLLRNSAQIIDERSAKKMENLGISSTSLFDTDEHLKNQWIRSNVVDDLLTLDAEQQAIIAIFEQIKENSYKIDKGLSLSAEAAKVRTLRLVSNLEKKLMRAEKRKHATSLQQIEDLKDKLFPNGVMQERVLNIAPMYVLYGDDFIESLLQAFQPLDYKFTILYA